MNEEHLPPPFELSIDNGSTVIDGIRPDFCKRLTRLVYDGVVIDGTPMYAAFPRDVWFITLQCSGYTLTPDETNRSLWHAQHNAAPTNLAPLLVASSRQIAGVYALAYKFKMDHLWPACIGVMGTRGTRAMRAAYRELFAATRDYQEAFDPNAAQKPVEPALTLKVTYIDDTRLVMWRGDRVPYQPLPELVYITAEYTVDVERTTMYNGAGAIRDFQRDKRTNYPAIMLKPDICLIEAVGGESYGNHMDYRMRQLDMPFADNFPGMNFIYFVRNELIPYTGHIVDDYRHTFLRRFGWLQHESTRGVVVDMQLIHTRAGVERHEATRSRCLSIPSLRL